MVMRPDYRADGIPSGLSATYHRDFGSQRTWSTQPKGDSRLRLPRRRTQFSALASLVGERMRARSTTSWSRCLKKKWTRECCESRGPRYFISPNWAPRHLKSVRTISGRETHVHVLRRRQERHGHDHGQDGRVRHGDQDLCGVRQDQEAVANGGELARWARWGKQATIPLCEHLHLTAS